MPLAAGPRADVLTDIAPFPGRQIRQCAPLLASLAPTLDAATQAALCGRLLVPHAGTQGLAYALLTAGVAAQAHVLGDEDGDETECTLPAGLVAAVTSAPPGGEGEHTVFQACTALCSRGF
jgi:hypothetical protein